MAEGGVTDPSCSINWHYKPDYIRVTVAVPGMGTRMAGIKNRKVDPKSAELSVSFDDNEAVVDCRLLKGTKLGVRYRKVLTADDLNGNLVAPAPRSSYKVKDNEVILLLYKR